MKTFNEVIKALSMCGRHPDCKGCPYENVSHPTEIGNTCKDIMHYDALYYMQDRMEEKPMIVESTTLILNRNMEQEDIPMEYFENGGI